MCGVHSARLYAVGESIQPLPLLYISTSVEICSFFCFPYVSSLLRIFICRLQVKYLPKRLASSSSSLSFSLLFSTLHDFQYNKTSYKFSTNKGNSPSFQLVVFIRASNIYLFGFLCAIEFSNETP